MRLDLTIDPRRRANALRRARERGVVLPTFSQLVNPGRIPAEVRSRLTGIGLSEVHPLNLFRITWHNSNTPTGDPFGTVNHIELPPSLTGVEARIIGLVGKWFPTGAHKVGAAFGCLIPKLVTGQFDPTVHKAVWPSTGNFCRGGAFDSALLGAHSVAVLPEGMSAERFAWLGAIAGEVVRTPGGESNVREIFATCAEIRRRDESAVVFNQFEEAGNYLWHHQVTGAAMLEVLEREMKVEDVFRGLVLSSGSAGTLAAGDFLKAQFPGSRIAVCEPQQCPTLLSGGYGTHRIEGIGDKHVPWIHNVRNSDLVIAIDDQAPLDLLRLFNDPTGTRFLASRAVDAGTIDNLPLLGISGIANLLAAIKFARWFELGPHDVVLTVFTDSVELYRSRLSELAASNGALTPMDADRVFHRHLLESSTDYMTELDMRQRRRIHNLKYFTWVEQHAREEAELDAQWSDPSYWTRLPTCVPELDTLIEQFNAESRAALH